MNRPPKHHRILNRLSCVLGNTEHLTGESTCRALGAELQAIITLLTATLCLLTIHYLKLQSAYYDFINWIPSDVRINLETQPFAPLLPEIWWAFWHFIGYALIPGLIIRYAFRQPMSVYGLRLGDFRGHIFWYIALTAPILAFVLLASFTSEFSTFYPFYHSAERSLFDLLAWETLYISQFVFLEFFFRGFMLRGCTPQFGTGAIFVMVIPYMMIHLSKPWIEATGAIFFGIALAILALRSRSIWGGVLVHSFVAVSMDLTALIQTNRFPQQWLP